MRPRRLTTLALTGLLAGLLAACGGSATPGTGGPAGSAGSTGGVPTTVPGGDKSTAAPEPGTFETAWGRAWDGLPAGFPVPPGATPAEPPDPAEGPVSGAFVVGRPVSTVVGEVQSALTAAGFRTESVSGPLEDGGTVIDSVGADRTCRLQTRVRPLGGTTMISILFGAACPWR